MAQLSFGQKLNLILWKNWNVALYHWRHIIFCFCVTFLFALLLIVLRCLVIIDRVEVGKYEPINFSKSWGELVDLMNKRRQQLVPLQYSCFVPRIAIAYAPNTSDYVNSIMNKANTEYLDGVTLVSYATTSELEAATISEHYLFSVKFDLRNQKKKVGEVQEGIYPNSLSFSLLLPSELRQWDGFANLGSNWRTFKLYDSKKRLRHPNDRDGDLLGYVREGFATVQNAISMAFISLRVPDKDFPTIKLQRFPRTEEPLDPLIQRLRFNVSFLLIFGYLYPCLCITWSFNKEKECQMMTFLEIMGISYTVQLIAWYINSFLILFISSLFFIAALKGHWCDGAAILQNSSALTLLVLMTSYILASISFTFMVSSFFVRRSTATLMLVLLWIFTYTPSLMSAFMDSSSHAKLILCIFSNCCMSMALNQILKYESLGQGFLWSSYFDKTTIDAQLTNGVLTIILLSLSILYALIGISIFHWRAGLFETIKKLQNTACFQAFSKKSYNDNYSRSTVYRSKRMSNVYEVNADFRRTYIEINGLTKMYNNTTVVQNFNMNLFEGEIMVLMGRNGAGKSTLLAMITGMLKPTKGTVIIDDIDIRKNPERAFKKLGVCLQENMLFPELNVFNQISFHCRMKGLSVELIDQEVKKYLLAMNLEENRSQNSGELSIGLKRYLSVCCALCAQSKFVVLDAPDTGMDLLVRKKFRDLLIHEKLERTILMTTHSTEDADCLADRIAIMSGGDLKCFGTSNFLQKIYGNGYRLVCVKGESCDSSVVTAAIQQFFTDRLVPESEIGTELSYRLDQKYVGVFPIILDYLQQNFLQLNIISVSIGESSVDDIFLSMSTDNPFGGDRARLTNILNGIASSSKDEKNFRFLQKTKNYKGFQLLLSQWKALLLKRFLSNFRARPIVFWQFLMPILLAAISFPMASKRDIRKPLPAMTYRLNQYPESITVLDVRNFVMGLDDFHKLILHSYKENINSMGVGHKFIETGNDLFAEFILKSESHYNLKYLIATSFSRNELKAWFNDYPLHTVPLALNMMHNAVLRAAINETNAFITVTLEPLPFMTSEDFSQWHTEVSVGGFMAINMTFCIGLIWSTGIMSLVKERHNNFKLIQYIHGARPSSYWQTVFFYDFSLILTVSTIIMIVILCFQHNVFTLFEVQIIYFFTLIVFGTFILPLNYAISWIFDDHISAFCVLTVFGIFGGVTFSTFMNVLERNYATIHYKEMDDSLKLTKSVKWVTRFVPHLALGNTLAKIFRNGKLKVLCSNEFFRVIAVNYKSLEECDLHTAFCCEDKKIWSWSEGLLPEFIAVVTISACSVIALVLLELRSVNKAGIFGTVIPEDNEEAALEDFKDWHTDLQLKDDSREKERIRVLTLKPKDYLDKTLIMKAVGKIQKHNEDFHRIYLVINHSECFGLFGSSISAKTAFMKMLIQNKASSYGQIYVKGLSLRKNLYEVYDQISYCQQLSTNLDEFSGFEVMKIFCLLHGIPSSEIEPICQGLARAFGFMSQFRKLIKFYTPGAKRRLHTSLAMLGNPSIIYLDEPMLGVDLASLRQLCHIICQVCNSGASVLFTSHSYNLMEIICSRIAFLTNGRLSHIGPPYELNELHNKDYLVKLKLKKIYLRLSGRDLDSTQSIFLPNLSLRAQTFVETTFPNAVMKDQSGNVMYFLIPSKNLKISNIFKALHRNSFKLDIETFFVSNDTLPLFMYETIEQSQLPSHFYSQIHL